MHGLDFFYLFHTCLFANEYTQIPNLKTLSFTKQIRCSRSHLKSPESEPATLRQAAQPSTSVFLYHTHLKPRERERERERSVREEQNRRPPAMLTMMMLKAATSRQVPAVFRPLTHTPYTQPPSCTSLPCFVTGDEHTPLTSLIRLRQTELLRRHIWSLHLRRTPQPLYYLDLMAGHHRMVVAYGGTVT
ncbi:hypothetical protein HanIR_Chr02g0068651 [Helianthus annuus]|nr:hypothetical protein HanIR_Chr02g0068651 [Helianthus annuus]